MRVKFIDSTASTMNNTTVLEISGFYLEDDTNKLILTSNEYDFSSKRPLSSDEMFDFETWANSLLTNGYADLTTNRSIIFVNESC